MIQNTSRRGRPTDGRYPQLRDPDWLRRQYVDLSRETKDIAAEIGCVPGAVRNRLLSFGIPLRPKPMTSNSSKYPQLHDEAWLREQHETLGRSVTEIAQELGCNEGSVTYHLRDFGIRPRGRIVLGNYEVDWRPKVCPRCGGQYIPSGPAQRFCSQDCRAGIRTCAWEPCGKDFRVPLPKSSKAPVSAKRFCSKDCLFAWRKANITRLPTLHRRVNSEGYVEVNVGPPRGRIKEHTLVMEQHLGRALVPGEEVHHRNGVRDDNRLANLELWAVNQPHGQRALDLLAWAEEIVARYAPDRDKL